MRLFPLFPWLIVAALGAALAACGGKAPGSVPAGDTDTDSDSDSDSSSDSDSDSDSDGDADGGVLAAWKLLVYLNADNDLETMFFHDMNELEQGGSDANVIALVQADRIEGYASSDGDWTDARRYRIVEDADDTVIASEVLEELGEVDMGDPATLVDFVAWAESSYPTAHTALIIWDHGDSWLKGGKGEQTKEFSYDDTSGSGISVADGEYASALASIEEILGKPLDLIGFDACTVASWETAMVSAEHVLVQASSEGYVEMEGFDYTSTLQALRANPGMDAIELGGSLAGGASALGEYTQSAVDLAGVPQLTIAVDALAQALLALGDPAGALAEGVDNSLTMDPVWNGYYQDLGTLAAFFCDNDHGVAVTAAAEQVLSSLDAIVAYNFALSPYEEATGLTICATDDAYYAGLYHESEGAVWAQETAWDELVLLLSD